MKKIKEEPQSQPRVQLGQPGHFLQAALEVLDEGVLIVAPENNINVINDGGITPLLPVGEAAEEWFKSYYVRDAQGKIYAGSKNKLGALLSKQGNFEKQEIVFLPVAGQEHLPIRIFQISTHNILSEDKERLGVIINFKEITKQRFQESLLKVQLVASEALANTSSLNKVSEKILKAIVTELNYPLVALWADDGSGTTLHCLDVVADSQTKQKLFKTITENDLVRKALPAEVNHGRNVSFQPDISPLKTIPVFAEAKRMGFNSVLFVPIVLEGKNLGHLQLFQVAPWPPMDEVVISLEQLGKKIGQFMGRIEAEKELNKHSLQMRAILDGVNDAVITFDEQGTIADYNPAAEKIFGYNPQEIMIINIEALVDSSEASSKWNVKELISSFNEADSENNSKIYEILGRKKDATVFPMEMKINKIYWNQRQYFVAILSDISKVVSERKALTHAASHDKMTGLANRANMEEYIEEVLAKASSQNLIVPLITFDINHFKRVNDVYGHFFGDEVLRITAARIRSVIRREDFFARIGGDEFVIIPQAPADLNLALSLSAKIASQLKIPFSIEERVIKTGISLGIACYPTDAQDAQTILRKADIAMYYAKRRKKDILVYSPDMPPLDVPPKDAVP